MAAKEVTIQVKYANADTTSTTKTYSRIKPDITLEQTANLAKFFQRLTDDL